MLEESIVKVLRIGYDIIDVEKGGGGRIEFELFQFRRV